MTVDEIVRNWGDAMELVKDNSRIMCGNPSREDVDGCASRMDVLSAAETELFKLKGATDLPAAVRNFLEADDDKGCMGCWVSSSRASIHEECSAKIDRWFRTRESLVEYYSNLKK